MPFHTAQTGLSVVTIPPLDLLRVHPFSVDKQTTRNDTQRILLILPRCATGLPKSFIEYALTYDGENCLDWPYGLDGHGYGALRYEGKRTKAYREICELAHGPKPPGDFHASHYCGNRKCVNPRHLSWKLRKDNFADKNRHGTIRFGETHQNAKWSNSQVNAVRILYDGGKPPADISRQLGIPYNTVRTYCYRTKRTYT